MDLIHQRALRLLCIPAAFMVLLVCLPAHADELVQGKMKVSSKMDGYYDLRLQFWDRTGPKAQKAFQVIEIPRVLIKDGLFTVSLDTALIVGKNIGFTIQSRGFESWQPFQTIDASFQAVPGKCCVTDLLGEGERSAPGRMLLFGAWTPS